MEMWEDHISHKEAGYNSNKHHRRVDHKNPSFSSSLLDSIYRSIDEAEHIQPHRERDLIFYKQTVTKKKHNTTTNTSRVSSHGVKEEEGEEIMSLKRACLIEKWMDIKKADKVDTVAARRNSTANFDTSYLKYSSSSSSSDSSYGGGFSSSELDSRSISTSTSSCNTMQTTKSNRTQDQTRLQPIKTREETTSHHHKPRQENQFVKTKSKALKIYMDLKKAKQPISPGGKLGSFLTSIFNNGKKHKNVNIEEFSKGSNCSSASSFSRSCLRKSSVSRGEISNNGDGDSAKRSVRFYLVEEDLRPCGHKTLEDDRRRQVEEVARSYLMKNCQKKTNYVKEMEEDDDDAASYASSDLFELDTVGVEERYREELPVYETTYLDRNRALANGMICNFN